MRQQHPHNRRNRAVAKAKAAEDKRQQAAIVLGGALIAGTALLPLLDLLLRLIRP